MFRLDRFLTLYFFRIFKIILKEDVRLRIPILMYHSISDEPESGHPYYWINTSPKRFYEQMGFLKDRGYKVISLSEAIDMITNEHAGSRNSVNSSNSTNPPDVINSTNSINAVSPSNPRNLTNPINSTNSMNPTNQTDSMNSINSINSSNSSNSSNSINSYVVLTFDDGYQDFLTGTFSILQDFGYPATMFLATGFIGKKTRAEFKGKPCLTWEEVRILSRYGVEIGSHTVTHRKLWELQWPEVEGELKGSKQMIEDETGKPVHHFSFPFAYPADKRWASIFREKLAGCGYLSCATTKVGRHHLAQDPLSLKRLPINDLDDLQFFEAKLSGGYDWVSTLQALYKPLKARLSSKANQGLGLAGSPER